MELPKNSALQQTHGFRISIWPWPPSILLEAVAAPAGNAVGEVTAAASRRPEPVVEETAPKLSIRVKRKPAGPDPDYLLKLLGN